MRTANYTSFIVHGVGSYGYAVTNGHGGYTSPVDDKRYCEPVRVDFDKTVQDAIRVCNIYKEESVLFVDQDRNAYLIFADGTEFPVGKFQRFKSHLKSHCEAMMRGYTRFNGRTYICV